MNVVYQNGWKMIDKSSFMLKIYNIFQIQAQNLGNCYTICQNAFQMN
jgi:hypothetical protein